MKTHYKKAVFISYRSQCKIRNFLNKNSSFLSIKNIEQSAGLGRNTLSRFMSFPEARMKEKTLILIFPILKSLSFDFTNTDIPNKTLQDVLIKNIEISIDTLANYNKKLMEK